MSTKRQHVVLIGGGAAACAACCAGPIVGFLAAIGLGTVVGVALFGAIALAIGASAVVIVLRRRQASTCTPPGASVDLEMPTIRTRR